MNKKVSPTVIGAFVVGALALLVIAVVALGSGQLFRHTKEFVLYFDGSVNGLHIGAPVKFKGVEIGAVKNILLQLNKDMEVNKIPVIIEIDLKKITSRGSSSAVAEQQEVFQAAIVDRGLRGQLQTESLVTGVLYVALDFFPGTPVNLVHQTDKDNKYPEIPTIPTELEQAKDAVTRIIDKLDEIDFKGMINSVTKASDGVSQLANSPTLKSVLQSLDQSMPEVQEAISDLRRLAATANNKVTVVSDDFHDVSVDLRQTLTVAQSTIEQFTATMKEAQETIVSVRATIDPDSPTFYELTKSLREVSGAASSIRLLADSLDHNPQAVILGKPETQEGK
jgi:paraquat-inducible protein B